MTDNKTRYLVFDIESVADPQLIRDVQYAHEDYTPEEAIRHYRDELSAKNNSDFIPYTYQFPVSIGIAKVDETFALTELAMLSLPQMKPHEITRTFWDGWQKYRNRDPQLALVSFNGRGFDLPLLELAAFRFGIPIPNWFAQKEKTFDQPRNRYNLKSHIDLCDLMTNNGATRFNGGLNLLAHILGKPGKMDTRGSMVQDMYDRGEYEDIANYCRCDVLDTYFVFLRTMVITGSLSLENEQQLVSQSKEWLEKRIENPAYKLYLDHWGDWQNPWEG
jgi:predicted PolB exonuclease-like 3'-5' exonuclease